MKPASFVLPPPSSTFPSNAKTATAIAIPSKIENEERKKPIKIAENIYILR